METAVIPISGFPFKRFLLAANPKLAASRSFATAPVLICALLLVSASPLCAQQPISLDEAALRGQTIYQQSGGTGMVLVVVRNHEVMVKGYGETAPGSGRAPDSASEIRLCSLSKVLAADLLNKLSAEGKVALTDPLQRYAPRGKLVPEGPGNTQITLFDLATHTSGLPREVSAYPRKTPHFTFPSHAVRWDWLPKQELKAPPGTAALYSNVGFDLLGDALATGSHMPYAKLLHDRILQPLDMWDTTLFPTVDQCARLLQGSGDDGPCTSTEASGASGGVYSTPADMVKLLEYLLHVPGSPAQAPAAQNVYLKPAALKSVQGLSHAGDPTGIGLAWVQIGDPDSPSALLEKTGGGAGFTTYIALSTSHQTGIFAAVTDGKGKSEIDFFHECNTLVAALANVPQLPPKVRPIPAPKRRAKHRRRPQI